MVSVRPQINLNKTIASGRDWRKWIKSDPDHDKACTAIRSFLHQSLYRLDHSNAPSGPGAKHPVAKHPMRVDPSKCLTWIEIFSSPRLKNYLRGYVSFMVVWRLNQGDKGVIWLFLKIPLSITIPIPIKSSSTRPLKKYDPPLFCTVNGFCPWGEFFCVWISTMILQSLHRLLNEDQSQVDAKSTSLGATFTDLPRSVRFTALQKG